MTDPIYAPALSPEALLECERFHATRIADVMRVRRQVATQLTREVVGLPRPVRDVDAEEWAAIEARYRAEAGALADTLVREAQPGWWGAHRSSEAAERDGR